MSLIARHLESHGIPTLCLASALDIIEAGNPPRAVFVDYPLGHTTGQPFDAADQLNVLRSAMTAFEAIKTPGEIVHLPNQWNGDDTWRAKAARADGDDTRQPRDMSPQYQTEEDRRLAEGG
ncbi:MAG: hypothetical protein K0U93_02265 [Gammaproteobacteria bacterium]|nr:hypothetical protein [Gammaproteobacteria bacterium]